MRTTKDKPISPQQMKALHATFHRIGLDADARHECISAFGRTHAEQQRALFR